MAHVTLPVIAGTQGPPGADGAAGPNTVTSSTTTNITGLLKGDGANIAQAVADSDYLTPATASSTYEPLISTHAFARNASAPNATIPSHSITPEGAESGIDLVLSPKGVGAIVAQVPDGTTTGGNKRGNNAVDLQTLARTAATQVASGLGSTVSGGFKNTASGNYGAVPGGTSNQANGANTFAANSSSISNGNDSSTFNTSCTSAGVSAFSRGEGSLGNGRCSDVSGYGGTANSIFGKRVHSSGIIAAIGDSQKGTLTLKQSTTNATPGVMVSGAAGIAAASTTNQFILANNTAMAFTGIIVGKQLSSTNCASWKIEGLVVRGANAASTVVVYSLVTLMSNAPGWGTPTLTADTTNGGLAVTVTGLAGTNIHWTCFIDAAESA